MGCDIHTYAERKNDKGQWELLAELDPFNRRSFRMFGWLADVRNYSAVPCIAQRRGVPPDASFGVMVEHTEWDAELHSASWLTLAELQSFDYDKPLEDRRGAWRRQAGRTTLAPGAGEPMTYREFLGEQFFQDLKHLADARADRVVFWFSD